VASPPRGDVLTRQATPGVHGPARHEVPGIDAAALEAARAADHAVAAAGELAAANAAGAERWLRYLAPLPDRLRDDPITTLRSVARTARSAYGPKDSIRDALPADATEPLLAAIDRLLKALARHDLESR
jgi:hypothetical protein